MADLHSGGAVWVLAMVYYDRPGSLAPHSAMRLPSYREMVSDNNKKDNVLSKSSSMSGERNP